MLFKLSKETLDKASWIADKCVECGACVRECKMLERFCSSPSDLFKRITNEKGAEDIIPYSCNLCGKCTKICPYDLKLGEAFNSMRGDIVSQNKGKSPIKGHRVVKYHQHFGFSKLFNLTIPEGKNTVKRVFIPGCSLTSYNPELVEKTFNYLNNNLGSTGLILMCCGKPTLNLGQNDRFKERYALLQREIDALGTEEVITACQNCFVTIGENSPGLKVKSLWTVIPEIGLPKESRVLENEDHMNFTIHDSCPTRYNSDIHDGVRWIVKQLGYNLVESKNSRENTNCCGFGGMVGPANKELARQIINNTAANLAGDNVVTYCASCREAVSMTGKSAVHILDLIFSGPYNSIKDFEMVSTSPLKSWSNRYKVKKTLKKYIR